MVAIKAWTRRKFQFAHNKDPTKMPCLRPCCRAGGNDQFAPRVVAPLFVRIRASF